MTKRALSLLLCLLMLLSILPMAAFAEDGEFDELPSEETGYQEEFLQEQDHLPDGDIDPQEKVDDNEGEKIQVPDESVPANYPQISLQPQDATAVSGKKATFTVKATQAKKYQWQVSKDGETWQNVPKATKNKLSVKAEKAVDGNLYRCVISNADGSVNSTAATLTVTLVLPTVLVQPANQNVRNTKKAAFSVKAKNAKKYQWQVSADGETWNDIPKATKNKYAFTATEDMDGNLYRCILINADGEVETGAAALSVYLVYPTVVTNPTDQSVRNGKKATFTVKGDKETKKYQWQVSTDGETWTDIPKATKNKYVFTAAESMKNNQYRCVLMNADGETESASATLTVGKVYPQVVTEPQDVKVKEGANATFTVKGDKETKRYQWQVSTDGGSTWKDVAKGTSAKLTVKKPAITLSGSQYRCILSNLDGETISAVATLTVGDEPAITAQPQSVTTSSGETVTFTIGAVNVTSYQWQRCPTGNAWTNIPGATDSSYTFTAEDTQNGYKFRCKLKNTVGETTSEAATLLIRNYFDVDLDAVKTGYINAGRSVHDPSIFVDNGTYYIFGSHMETAKSTDLRKWTGVGTNGYVAKNSVYGNIINNKNAFAWAGRNTSVNPTDGGTTDIRLWAPDVIYNPTMGKYMMYFCTTSSAICSSIGFGTADKASGPYTFQSLVLYSGFTSSTVDKTDAAQYTNDRYTNNTSSHSTFPNAIDPSIFFDKDGRFWMVYGSWSGGIWLLELDPATGKRIQNADYTHSYFGYKLGGGNRKSGEAPYILWDEEAGYYYLFVSYGGLQRTGGYQIRVFRSENVTGPYVDQRGNSYLNMPSGDQRAYGVKISGNYMLPSLKDSYMATGHNSAFIETKDGVTRRYVVYHTRFENSDEYHQPRVRQYVLNEEGWPCILPYATAGEAFSAADTYTMDDVAGRYYVTSQGIAIDGNVAQPVIYRLNADGTILLGDGTTGTWSLVEGTPYIHYTLNKQTYKGILCPMKDEAGTDVLTFSALYLNYSVLGVKY